MYLIIKTYDYLIYFEYKQYISNKLQSRFSCLKAIEFYPGTFMSAERLYMKYAAVF